MKYTLLKINDYILWSCMLQNERYLPIETRLNRSLKSKLLVYHTDLLN